MNEFADPEVRGVRGVFVGAFWKAWCGNGEQNKVTLADSATSAQPQPFCAISVRLAPKTNVFIMKIEVFAWAILRCLRFGRFCFKNDCFPIGF